MHKLVTLPADFWMSCQIGLSLAALVNTGSIPDQYDPVGHMTFHMLECGDQLFTFEGTFKMTFVDLARHHQGYCSRQNPRIPCHSTQDGPFASPSPGCRQWFQVREAKFIKEYDDCAETQRLFLSLNSLLPAMPLPVLRLAQHHVAMASEHCEPT